MVHVCYISVFLKRSLTSCNFTKLPDYTLNFPGNTQYSSFCQWKIAKKEANLFEECEEGPHKNLQTSRILI